MVADHEYGIPRKELDGIAIQIGQIRLLFQAQGRYLVDDDAPRLQQPDDGVNLPDLSQVELSNFGVGKSRVIGDLFQSFTGIIRQPEFK